MAGPMEDSNIVSKYKYIKTQLSFCQPPAQPAEALIAEMLRVCSNPSFDRNIT